MRVRDDNRTGHMLCRITDKLSYGHVRTIAVRLPHAKMLQYFDEAAVGR